MVRSKSRIGGAGIAGALALLALAGCGGSKDAAKPPAKPAKAVFVAGDVSFGVLAPTSGAHAERGRDLVDGAKMAVAELNVRGGVNGHKAALVTYDDGCDAATAREQSQALLNSDVAGAVGGVCDGAASAAAHALGSDLPFLVTSANAPGIVSPKKTPRAFLTNGTPYQSALATSRWFVYQRAQTLAVVTEDDRESKFVADELIKLAAPVPKLKSRQTVAAGTADWSAAADAALKGDPQTVYWAGSAAGAAGLVKALRAAGFEGNFVASAQAESPEFLQAAGESAEGAVVIAPASPQHLPEAAKWAGAFETRFKRAPGFDALQAYEGVRALAQAVMQTGKVDRALNSRELAVPDAGYKTLLGDPGLTFATDHTIKHDNNIALKIEAGKFVVADTMRSGAEG
jgi:branched-chain amino acid transport system substrate-binding protein